MAILRALPALSVLLALSVAPAAIAQDPPPPAPPQAQADFDGDKVLDRVDVCPNSPAGARAAVDGCSLLDVVTRPDRLLDDVSAPITGVRAAAGKLLPRKAALTIARNRLGSAVSGLRSAARLVATDPCGATSRINTALAAAKGGTATLRAAIGQQQVGTVKAVRKVNRNRPAARRAPLLSPRVRRLATARREATESYGRLRRTGLLLKSVCQASTGKKTVTGKVMAIDKSGTQAKLDTGVTLVFASQSQLLGVGPGETVQASGYGIAGNRVVTSKARGPKPTTQPPAQVDGCAYRPRIAPVQDLSRSDALFSDYRGYLRGSGGRLALEQGMGLGVAATLGCGAYSRTFATAFLEYTSGNQSRLMVLGSYGLGQGPLVGRFDELVFPVGGTLIIETYGDCEACAVEGLIDRTRYPVFVAAQGYWAEQDVKYDRYGFSLEDGGPASAFEVATLQGSPSEGSVFGYGYGVNGGASSFPNVQLITEGQSFAVHDGDTNAPTGLNFAYKTGFTNGFPYHHVAQVRRIVTDRIDGCPAGSATANRLPFKAGTGRVWRELVNAGAFILPVAAPLYASRGGVVTEVHVPSLSDINFSDTSGLTSLVSVQHQDGTTTHYSNAAQSTLKVGDLIERGDRIGSRDNGDDRLIIEFQIDEDSYVDLDDMAYEYLNAGNKVCNNPPDGGIIVSTNVKP